MAGSKQTVLLLQTKRILQPKRFYSNINQTAYRFTTSLRSNSSSFNLLSKSSKKESSYRANYYGQIAHVAKLAKHRKNLGLYDLVWLLRHTDHQFDPDEFMVGVHAILEEISKCSNEANTKSLLDSGLVTKLVLRDIDEWIKNKNPFTFSQQDVYNSTFYSFEREYMPSINMTCLHMNVTIDHFENGSEIKKIHTALAQKWRLFPVSMESEDVLQKWREGLKKNGVSSTKLIVSRKYDTKQNKLIGHWMVTALWRKNLKPTAE